MKLIAKQPFVDQRYGLFLYSVVAAVIAFFGAALFISAAYGVAHTFGTGLGPNVWPEVQITWLGFFLMVVFAPAVGTLLLAVTISVLAKFLRSKLWISVLAAFAWGAIHSIGHRFWFFGAVWPFFVFSYCYLIWRPRSLKHALAAAAIPHFLVTLSVFIGAALSASS